MVKLFTVVVNMSITASFVMLAVMAARFCLKKAPKAFSYFLWLAVFIRLICPVTLQADFGVVPDMSVAQLEKLSNEAGTQKMEYGYKPDKADLSTVNPETGSRMSEEKQELNQDKGLPYKIVRILAIIWLLIGCMLILYEVISYGTFMGRLRKENGRIMKTAEKGRSFYIRISDNINTPFLAGFLRPVIYLPDKLSDVQRELVTEHEKMHIRRLDYLIKPAAFLICCIHWFNPLVWAAFSFMERDMEASCDEAVLRKIGFDRKKEYANTLLNLSLKEGWQPGYPIGFGENSVKSRIKNAVNLKKTSFWGMTAAAVIVAAVVVILLINRKETADSLPEVSPGNMEVLVEQQPELSAAGENADGDSSFLKPYEEYDKPAENSGEQEYNYIESIPGSDAYDGHESEYFVSEEDNETITNYVPARDQFENLLLNETGIHNDMRILYSYPVESARISDGFGTRIHPVTRQEKLHSGIDFAADAGTAVTAAADGTVVETGFDVECGNYIILQHSNGDMTYYACCEEILGEEGSEVKRGEQIATVGSTGLSTGSHLHFAVSRGGSYIEPEFQE